MNDFEKYKNASLYFNLTYRGYELRNVLSLHLWNFANNKFPFKIKHFAKLFLAYSLKDIKFEPDNQIILSTFGTYPRNDHKRIYDNVLSQLGNCVSKNVLINPSRCFHLSIKSISYVLQKGIPAVSKIQGISIQGKIGLLLELIFWCNTIEVLCNKIFPGVQKYLCFLCTYGIENLLTQHFKLAGIPTYSLTHGSHHIIHKNPEPGMLVYDNIDADHILMWGEYSINEFSSYGINKNKLHLAGYPKPFNLIKFKKLPSLKRCIVLLSQHYFYEQNMRLLNLLSNFTNEYDFTIKPHPSTVDYYVKFANKHGMRIIPSNETIEECLSQDKYDWAIAVNTNAYYDALMNGVFCLRYGENTFDDMPGCDDVFENVEMLKNLLTNMQHLSVENYQNEVNNILKYVLGIGINNYREIILGADS